MRKYGKDISYQTLQALKQAQITEGGVKFDFTMSREVYDEINEIFRRMRGKWKSTGKKTDDGTPIGQFVFDGFKPTDFLPQFIATGEMPPDNPTDFYPTPKSVVKKMIEWAELQAVCDYPDEENEYDENGFSSWFVPDGQTLRILEPSAGTGGIADQIRKVCPAYQLDVIEMLPINANILRGKGYEVIEQDFLSWLPPYKYNAILMNPPYDGTSYIDHVMHGWSLLNQPDGEREDFGVLVAILPTSWQYRTDNKCAYFRKLVTEYGWWEALPSGTFKDSGTNIETCIMALSTDKREKSDEEYRWHIDVIMKNNFSQGLYKEFVQLFDPIECDTEVHFRMYEKFETKLRDIAEQIVRYHQGYKSEKDRYGYDLKVPANAKLNTESSVQYFRPKPHVIWQVVSEWVEEGFSEYRHECDTMQPFIDGWKMYSEIKKIQTELAHP